MNQGLRPHLPAIVLPAVLVLVAYALFFFNPQVRELNRQREQLATASETAVTQNDLLAEGARLKAVSRTGQELATKAQALESEWAKVTRRWASPRDAELAPAISRLTDLLTSEGLFIVETVTETEHTESELPLQISQFRKRLESAATANSQICLFTTKVIGPYSALRSALGKISEQQIGVLPVGLAMETADLRSQERVWRLTVWCQHE